MRKPFVLVALGLVAITAAAAWLLSSARTPRPSAAHFGPGTYALTYDFAIEFPGRKGPVRAETALAGTLEVAQKSEEWLVARTKVERYALNELARRITDLSEDAAADELGRPFALRLEPDGRVAEVRFADGLSAAARAFAHAIASGTQYARPENAEATTWTANEQDVNGGYLATYALEPDGTVRKTWNVGGALNPEAPTGEVSVRYTLSGSRVEAVDYRQQADALVGSDAAKRSPFTTRLRVTRTGSPKAAPWAPDPKQLRPLDPDSVEVEMPGEPPPRELAVVLDSVREVPANKTQAQHSTLRSELTRAIAADASAPARIQELLREDAWSDSARTLLVEGLVGARTSAAQHVVGSLLSAPEVSRATQIQLLQATALLDVPNAGLVSALGTLVTTSPDQVYRAQVAMTYAAAAAQLARGNPSAAQQIAQVLVEQAEPVLNPHFPELPPRPDQPSLPDDPPSRPPDLPSRPDDAAAGIRIDWVRALGNLGIPEARPLIVATLLDDPDELVRAAAAHSLRWLDPATVRDDMDRAMATDPSIHVRYELTQAARVMGPTAMETFVQKALVFDTSEWVRLGAAHTMTAWVADAPRLRRVLAEALAREKSLRVQEALRNYLEPGRLGEGVQATGLRSAP